jgi:MFS family permease
MASFGMVVPELPAFLAALGRPDLIGWIIGSFTVGAFLSRFVSGRVTDEVGRRPVMVFGSWVAALSAFGYLLLGHVGPGWAVGAFFTLRFIHGISAGFRPTGATAYTADIVPVDRRGAAMGWLGVAGNAGMAGGPALGSVLAVEWGMDAMFAVAAALGALSLALTWPLKETLEPRRKLVWGDLAVWRGKPFDRAALPPSLAQIPVAFAFGAFLAITPDFVGALGFTYKGTFNTIAVVASIVVRMAAGGWSDRWGRIPVIAVGNLLLAAGMAGLALSDSPAEAIAAGIVYGASVGLNAPAIFAWTADLARPGATGLALGTMMLAMEIGIGAGALFAGYLYAGDLDRIAWVYGTCAVWAALAALRLAWLARRSRSGA